MGERSANSMRSPAGAAVGRHPLLCSRPRILASAALGAVKILLMNTTPKEWLAEREFLCSQRRCNRTSRGPNVRTRLENVWVFGRQKNFSSAKKILYLDFSLKSVIAGAV